jgi:hypothetical protein
MLRRTGATATDFSTQRADWVRSSQAERSDRRAFPARWGPPRRLGESSQDNDDGEEHEG